MAKYSSIRQRNKRPKRELFELDITSLLDILVIILVFLIKNFNASGIEINPPKGFVIPFSNSQTPKSEGEIIQLSSKSLYIGDKKVAQLSPYNRRQYRMEGRLVGPLYDQLIQIRDKKYLAKKRKLSKEDFSGQINMVVDSQTPYNLIKKVMFTCGLAGFNNFRFIVRSEEG